jgi:hypothetical protein
VATNSKKPGKWPDYAARCKDETKFLAGEIKDTAKNAQLAILGGDHGNAIVLCGDIRDLANNIIWQMVQAEAGIYEESAAIQDAIAERQARAV